MSRLQQIRELRRPADLRAARKALGLTQAQLAPLLGYGSKSRIAELESGRREPGEAVVRLLKAYLSGYRPKDWPVVTTTPGARRIMLEVTDVTPPPTIVNLPADERAVALVTEAMRSGLRKPGDIARSTRLGLPTVQEAIAAIKAARR